MAYYDDEEKNRRFVGGGSAAVRQGTGGRGSGGYTNMGALLQANQGFDSKLKEKAAGLESDALGQVGAKEKEAQGLKFDARQIDMQGVADLVGKDDQTSLRDGMNQKYDGPRESSIDLNKLQSFSDLKRLQDPNAAGAMMANPNDGYTGGQRAFDSALFGASTARGEINKNVEDITGKGAAADKLFADRVGGFDRAAEEASKGFRGQLGAYYDRLIRNVDDRVAGEKKAESDAFKYGLPATDMMKQASGPMGTANRNNQVTEDEARQFGTLSALLGTDAIARDPNYQRAMANQVFSPAAANNGDDKTRGKFDGAHMPSQTELAASNKAVKDLTRGGGMTGTQARTTVQNVNKAKDKKRDVNQGKYRTYGGSI